MGPAGDASSWHGVTTIVMGNCGVGFAPVRPGSQEWLVQLMEGVEDIPGTALTEGITWGWESFPEYLTALDGMGRVVDVGTQVPHGAVRAYVMGERGSHNEPATPEDIAAMAALVKEGIAAGALGFSTSRTIVHRAVDGEPVPGTFAAEDEISGSGRRSRPSAPVSSSWRPPARWAKTWRRPNARWPGCGACRRPSGVRSASLSSRWTPRRTSGATSCASAAEANAEGADLRPQVAGRALNILLGLPDVHPFSKRPTYKALADLPLAERIQHLRKDEVRRAILAEKPSPTIR